MKNDGCHSFRPNAVEDERSDRDLKKGRNAYESLLQEFPVLASRSNMFTDECTIYLRSWARNVYIRSKKNPHYCAELRHHSPHVMM